MRLTSVANFPPSEPPAQRASRLNGGGLLNTQILPPLTREAPQATTELISPCINAVDPRRWIALANLNSTSGCHHESSSDSLRQMQIDADVESGHRGRHQ